MMDQLKKKYFMNQDRIIFLHKGEYLFKKGEKNNRLFLLESGRVKGIDPDNEWEYMELESGDFAGLNSFFSFIPVTRMNVIALEDSVLPYIEKEDYSSSEAAKQLAVDFMPAVVFILVNRQEQAYQASLEHQRVLREMQEVERLASLGQLSAVVAHELNNAVTVIGRGSDHISKELLKHFRCSPFEMEMIQAGLTKGRAVSSAQARAVAKDLMKNSSFSEAKLRDYARTGMGDRLIKEPVEVAQRAFELWSFGASLHDLQIAAKQSEHVVSSMKSLASTSAVRQPGCDINESIQKALFLLSNPLGNINLTLELNEVPSIYGNSGELVQVWTNIINNMVDAMKGMPRKKTKLSIKCEPLKEHVKVTITNNGPKIEENMLKEIFKPHVTTKKDGQAFGLGLGLTIVDKIVNRYAGNLSVESTDTQTQFIITLPIGEQ